MQKEIAINDVYIPHLDNYARTQIFFGGSSSGKSWFVVGQRTVIDLLGGGRNYLICRAVARTIRTSVFTQIERLIIELGIKELFDINKSEMTITCRTNGYQALFAGLDDVEKIKSITPKKGAITDIVIEEATETSKEDVKSLYKRQRGGSEDVPKRFTLLFNPIFRQHWLFEEYFAPLGWTDDQTEYVSDSLTILKTTHVDNRFLTTQDHADLENEKDPYFHSVYTLGNFGVLGDVIFANWKIQDLSEMRDQFVNPRHGLDFGFGGAPAGMPVTHYDSNHKTIYIYDELYEYGLTNNLLAEEMKKLIGNWTELDGKQVCNGTEPVCCDSAEPKSITELQQNGINAFAAKKGKDSVNFGIQWLKQQTIVIDKKCVKTQMEFQTYQWKKDKDGNSMKVPVDKNNHIIDGLRYAYEGDMVDTWTSF